jgi:cytoskeletal protein RodZ
MRSTFRLFMAAILFTAVAGVVSAQDASAAPPPTAPDVVKPVDQLPPIPIAEPVAPAIEPAQTIDQSALAVEPVAPATVEPPAAEKPVTTTVKRVATKKTAKKPAENPAIPASEAVKAAPAAASTAVDTTANMPPPNAAANTAPLKSIAPPPPPANPVAVEETKSQTTMGLGGWLLAGIAVAALFGIITLIRRRRTQRRTSIVDLSPVLPELEAAVVTHP